MDLSQIVPQFGGAAVTVVAFVVALSVIVAVHEYGHYIVGRWAGIHAEVFSLGFGPVLFAGTDRRGTRWQVAALPFGGYVKFLGDANAASMGGAEAGVPPAERRRTMGGAPLWARAATVAAGPVANFILSIAIFAGVMLVMGQPSTPLTVAALPPLPPSIEQGLRPGDEIVAIDGRAADPATLGGLVTALPAEATVEYRVRRDGAEATVRAPRPDALPIVGTVVPRSAAHDVDMRRGDVILAVDGEPVDDFGRVVEIVEASGGRPLLLDVWRAGEAIQFTVVPRRTDLPAEGGGFETAWKVGLAGLPTFFDVETERPGLGVALREALARLGTIFASSLSGFWAIVSGAISTCNLSGPVGIAEVSGAMASQGVSDFVWFVGVLSAAVGLMNLFPIPVLDGGHLVFHAWEALTGRPPGDRALRVLMAAGLSIILTMTALAVANDLVLCP